MEIKVVRKVLDVNDEIARQNRELFAKNNLFVLNMMSSPGSGKTTILEKTMQKLAGEMSCGIIVGDICTTNDAERLAAAGIPVIQINTDEFGGDCHLAAHAIRKAAGELDLQDLDLLVVENVGNLVCPAEFDIGENARVVVLSVTEGEDKPTKYPLMFRECNATLLNKIDLLPYLEYDISLTRQNIVSINPNMMIAEVSAKTLDGFGLWLDWLTKQVR